MLKSSCNCKIQFYMVNHDFQKKNGNCAKNSFKK